MQVRTKFVPPCLLASASWLLCSAPAAAQSMWLVQIEQDGKVILQGNLNGGNRVQAWLDLERAPLRIVVGPQQPGAPEKLTLRGDLQIKLYDSARARQLLAEATVDELQLMRAPGTVDRWLLAPDEVRRTAKAAGLKLP